MAYDILQNSTQSALRFLMIASSDHTSPSTGQSPVVLLLKNGATAFTTQVGVVTEIGYGWYSVAVSSLDTNTLGPLALHASGTTTADITDVLVANIVAYNPQAVNQGLTAVSANVTQVNGYTVSGTGKVGNRWGPA